ncbi:hypothetical protein CONPUDRAFT_75502 [Coniophora puteana RWD-64-598 SS2]|uniref:Uncharacterized protein n=1 Tax=Coniophora puteana (strain RWD-64-598) TaxID=741705 RepID=A0A5M3MEN2_CONPW|nr:uncharacterized protein CONPUDRAFT_75502 [Coniophora puteana RWD-64-598 SS2]EIW77682.1 hypothetical protein CONPUDRAFT_75502 [Coniophora puteana RWD-64-598 SS2]
MSHRDPKRVCTTSYRYRRRVYRELWSDDKSTTKRRELDGQCMRGRKGNKKRKEDASYGGQYERGEGATDTGTEGREWQRWGSPLRRVEVIAAVVLFRFHGDAFAGDVDASFSLRSGMMYRFGVTFEGRERGTAVMVPVQCTLAATSRRRDGRGVCERNNSNGIGKNKERRTHHVTLASQPSQGHGKLRVRENGRALGEGAEREKMRAMRVEREGFNWRSPLEESFH